MGEAILAIEGTDTGRLAATLLALVSAAAHAAFGALQKGRHDPWLSRAAIDAGYGLMALPVALLLVPWPEPRMWPVLAGVLVIHAVYKWLMAMAYSRGDYTAVYPVVRGTGPIATVAFAWIVFGEVFRPLQWVGVVMLSGGILGLAVVNLGIASLSGVERARARLGAALWFAFATGIMTAVYTTYDAYGIRLAPDPFTFLAWFFVVDALVFPAFGPRFWARAGRPPLGPLALRGIVGGLTGFLSFGSVMLATRLDKVGEAAALRETSVIFAALIGWLVLGERVGRRQAALMVVIALGAILIETG